MNRIILKIGSAIVVLTVFLFAVFMIVDFPFASTIRRMVREGGRNLHAGCGGIMKQLFLFLLLTGMCFLSSCGGSVQSEFESETINDQSVPDARHFYLSFSMRRLSYIIAIPNMILMIQGTDI